MPKKRKKKKEKINKKIKIKPLKKEKQMFQQRKWELLN